MKKHRSKQRWLQEHHTDSYVRQAKKDGYRSRAAYKLLEIDKRDRLLRPGMIVVDLGAAPGGWSQVVLQRVGAGGRVLALDRLTLPPLDGLEIFEGDIDDESCVEAVRKSLHGRPVDLVISDMAPNISGMDAIDQPRSIYLAELAADFSLKVLRPGGDMLVKVFQGSGTEAFIKELRSDFEKVVIRKPKSSRDRSREVYVLGRGCRAQAAIPVG